jgi:hypothetical protein
VSRPTEAFALAVLDPDGERWQYISQAASFGNAMRTRCPFAARTWPTVAEARAWAEDRRRGVADVERRFAERRFAERGDRLQSRVEETEYTLVPLAIAVGDGAGTLVLASLEAREGRKGVPAV